MSAKLINNLVAVVNIGQAFHALRLGRAAGVDPVPLRQAILDGTGRTFAMDLIERLQVPSRSDHVRSILVKDVALDMEVLPKDEVERWRPLAENGPHGLGELVSGDRKSTHRNSSHQS